MKESRNRRIYDLTKYDLQYIGKVAEDEIFKHFPNEDAVWISNYGRIISKRNGNVKLLTTDNSGVYERIRLETNQYSTHYTVHRVVAKTFLPDPTWINDGDKCIVHHIKPVLSNQDDPYINRADNLLWLPTSLHSTFESVLEVAILQDKHFRVLSGGIMEATKLCDVTPYEFCELIHYANFSGGKEFYRVGDQDVRIKRKKRN